MARLHRSCPVPAMLVCLSAACGAVEGGTASPVDGGSSGSAAAGSGSGGGSSGAAAVSSSSTAVDPCAGVTCAGYGTCAAAAGVASCACNAGFHADGLSCVADGPCDGVTCSGHGTCAVQPFIGTAACHCNTGFHEVGLACVSDANPCEGVACSGHGSCRAVGGNPVCACDAGFTPSSTAGMDCLPTAEVCRGGAINYDVDGDGTADTWFEPLPEECRMFELVNFTRATHDDEGSGECHGPLAYSLEWSAHARNHSKQCAERGGLFHADYPMGQNCAYGCDEACEMNLYMSGANEDHCPAMSHHCNIMRCGFSYLGVGTWAGTWNTQNFY
ncbi:MAG: hypothetical protein HY904_04130 [Deltaproteobacteria bacterium]|nr:hypothetical protein [Deltaproteobacteria bacterium]